MNELFVALIWIAVGALHYLLTPRAQWWINAMTVAVACIACLMCWYVNRRRRAECRQAVADLQHFRATLEEYRRWLASVPNVSTALDNLQSELNGEQLSAQYPPNRAHGPWTLPNLREVLQTRQFRPRRFTLSDPRATPCSREQDRA